MFRPYYVLALACGLVLSAGCCRERDATVDDVNRFIVHAKYEQEALIIDINRFVISNALVAENLPLDVGRFIEWRKREWVALPARARLGDRIRLEERRAPDL